MGGVPAGAEVEVHYVALVTLVIIYRPFAVVAGPFVHAQNAEVYAVVNPIVT